MYQASASTEPYNPFKPEFRQRRLEYRTPSPPGYAVEPISPTKVSPQLNANQDIEVIPKKRRYDHSESQDPTLESHWPNPDLRSFSSRGQRAAHPGPTPIDTQASSHPQPSALDIFATIATSPSLHTRDFSNSFQYPITSQVAGTDTSNYKAQNIERTSKRSRSEVIKQRPAVGYSSRPTTSYIYPSAFSPTSPRQQSAPYTGYGGHDVHPEHKPLDESTLHALEDEVTLRQDAELLLSISRGFTKSTHDADLHHGSLAETVYKEYDNSVELYPYQISRQSGNLRKGYLHRRHDSLPENTTTSGTTYGMLENARPNNIPATNMQPTTVGIGSDFHLYAQPTSKPKDHRGWPKGKPRGPRNVGYDGRKRTKNPRRKDSVSAEKSNSKHKNKAAPTQILQQSEKIIFDVPEEVRRPRRGSDTRIKRNNVASDPLIASPSSRCTSCPPSVSLPTNKSSAKRAKLKKEAHLDICGACKMNRNATEGLHELWINCNGCKSWFHTTCAGFRDEKKVKDVDKFYCRSCEVEHGPTTFVRKSSRAHASVDYAGLNEGKIRTADDIPDHHYIEPIKNGTIEFQPETFARLPPELVTRDYFEKCGLWSEPVVVPASLNPQSRLNSSEDHHASIELPTSHGQLSVSSSLDPETEAHAFHEDYEYDCVPDDGQDSLDMVIPRGLTVRRVAELYGPEEKVDVIDVKLQEGEDKRWSMRQWADYYEAAGDKPVRNVISLEVSQSILGKLIRRPKVVRDLDLQDSVWPEEETAKGIFPRVQFYCLMSVADCYTDFHIDFGGSSVYYHILKGRKTFFFIPPKPKYLKKYEEWCNSPDQNSVFLGNETKECYRVDLYPGDTMLIPSGWIHAVWTPENSLVIGGNFLTRMHLGTQIAVNEIEKATNVIRKFRYPHFQKILWLTVVRYLQQDPIPSTIVERLCKGEQFEREGPVYLETVPDPRSESSNGAGVCENFNARFYSQGEIEGLPDLVRYIYRTVMIALGKAPGVSKKTQDAVIKSLPKECGDHLEALRTFAMWVAWKRGNENIPAWAYPDAPIDDLDAVVVEKKPSTTSQRKQEQRTAQEALDAAETRRISLRTPPKPASDVHRPASSQGMNDANVKVSRSTDSRRVACDVCRKRRRRCTHSGNEETSHLQPDNTVPSGRFGVKIVQPVKVEESDAISSSHLETECSTPITIVAPAQYGGVMLHPTPQQQMITTISPSQYPPTAKWATDGTTPTKPMTEILSDSTTRFVSKPPKSRACEACRKSKRRCTHNPFSESSLLPVRESLVHRISSAAKRASDSGAEDSSPLKKARTKSDISDSPSLLLEGPLEPDAVSYVTAEKEFGACNANGVDTNSGSDGFVPCFDTELNPHTQFGEDEELHSNDSQLVSSQHPSRNNVENAILSSQSPEPHDSSLQRNRSSKTKPQRPVNSHTDNSNSRSRTSSEHLQTIGSSSDGVDGSRSPPTSPLTDLDTTSPNQEQDVPNVLSEASADGVLDASSTGHTPRQAKHITKYADGAMMTPTAPLRKSSSSTGASGSKVRRQSTASNSAKASRTTPMQSGKAGAILTSPFERFDGNAEGYFDDTHSESPSLLKAPRDLEEEESLRLAKILAAEDAGLRRRGGAPLKYTR